MSGQSVLDVKFQDLMPKDFKVVLNKTLDDVVKELKVAVGDALGISGKMTDLGVISTRDGAIGGVRFGVDDARFGDVQQVIKKKLGSLAERAGVAHLGVAHRNSRMNALLDKTVQIYDDDPIGMQALEDYIKQVNGRIIQTYHNKAGYTTVRAQMPNAHFRGSPLSVSQSFSQFGAISADTHAELAVKRMAAEQEAARQLAAQKAYEQQQREENKAYYNQLKNRYGVDEYGNPKVNFSAIAGEEGFLEEETVKEKAAELATRKPDLGVLSGDADERYFQSQEERRKKLGIVSEETAAERSEAKSFLTSTKMSLAALVVVTKQILTAVLKLLDKELQQSYTAQAMNMNIDDLASLEKGVEAMTGRTGIATAAARGVFGAFGPTQVNSEAAKAVALASGTEALNDVINNMVLGGRVTTDALKAILEGAYANYAKGVNIYGEGIVGRDRARADIAAELKSLGMDEMFLAYARYQDTAGKYGSGDFDSFLRYRRIYGADKGAAAGQMKTAATTYADVKAANAVNNVVDFGPGDAEVVGNPEEDLTVRLLRGLGKYAANDRTGNINRAFNALSNRSIPDNLDEVSKILRTRLRSLDSDTSPQAAQEREMLPILLKLLDDYEKSTILGALSPESIAAGTSMAALGGGTNYFDYSSVTNTAPPAAQGNGTFNIRITTDKSDVVFPGVPLNEDNYVTVWG